MSCSARPRHVGCFMFSSLGIHVQLLHVYVLLRHSHSLFNLFEKLVLPLHLQVNQSIGVATWKPIERSAQTLLVFFHHAIEITLAIARTVYIIYYSCCPCCMKVMLRLGKLVVQVMCSILYFGPVKFVIIVFSLDTL